MKILQTSFRNPRWVTGLMAEAFQSWQMVLLSTLPVGWQASQKVVHAADDLARVPPDTPIQLRLDEQHILSTRIRVPLAARHDLPLLVSEQLEFLSPLLQDDRIDGFEIIGDRQADPLTIAVHMAKKSYVDSLLIAAKNNNILVDGLLAPSGCALAVPQIRHRQALARLRTAGKIFLLALALIAAPLLFVGRLDAETAALRDTLSSLTVEARPILDMRNRIASLRERQQFLRNYDQNSRHADILALLTATFDDQSHATEVRFDGARISLSGISHNVTALARSLSNALPAARVTVMSTSPATGSAGEQFQIDIQMRVQP